MASIDIKKKKRKQVTGTPRGAFPYREGGGPSRTCLFKKRGVIAKMCRPSSEVILHIESMEPLEPKGSYPGGGVKEWAFYIVLASP